MFVSASVHHLRSVLARSRPSHPLVSSLKTLAEHRSDLEAARKEVDESLKAPGARIAPAQWVKAMTGFILALADVRRDALTPTSAFDNAYRNNLQVKESAFLASEFAGRERAVIGIAIANGRPLSEQELQSLHDYRAIVDVNLAMLASATNQSAEGSGLKLAYGHLNDEYLGRFQRLREGILLASANNQSYSVGPEEWFSEATRGIDSILAMAHTVSGETKQIVASTHAEQMHAILILSLAALGVIATFVLGGLIVLRRIVHPLNELGTAARAIAEGNFDQKVQVRYHDELGELGATFEQMRLRLGEIIQQVRMSAESVASGTEQISSSTEQMSKTIEVQALATDESSTSMAMMAASIQRVAQNVSNAHSVSTRAVDTAKEGREVVEQTISGMTQISGTMNEVTEVIERLGQSSAQIGAIVELIGDIAKQTNLLALNATIEAARAGENGKGFAVVADEVRQLAKRSAEATGNISQLIQGIQSEVERAVTSTRNSEVALLEGTHLAQRAGGSLTDIVQAVAQMRDLMDQINGAVQDQSQASEQIVKSSESVNTSTQESTLAIGLIADAAHHLLHQAHGLTASIAFFRAEPSMSDRSLTPWNACG